MDVTGHLRAFLDAAIGLADHFGAPHRKGRTNTAALDQASCRAVRELLGLASRQVPELDTADLAEFRAAGVALYAALRTLLDGDEDAAAGLINDLLRTTNAAPWLVRHGDAPWHLHFAGPEGPQSTGWIADMATSVAMLIGSEEARRLRGCRALRCDNCFLDTTRNRVRRYCSTDCQNRSKVAAFRAREAGTS